MSYSVRQRTREIGVRMAIGAHPSNILWLIIRRGLVLVAAGLVAGLFVGLVFAHFLRSMLVEIPPTDPITLLAVVLLLAMAALMACCIPAIRVIRIDLVVAMWPLGRARCGGKSSPST